MRALKRGRAFTGFFGVSEGRGYSAVISEEDPSSPPSQSPQYPSRKRKMAAYWDAWVSIRQWSVPYLELNAGQSTYPTQIYSFFLSVDQYLYFSFHPCSVSCDHVGMHHQRCTPCFQSKQSRYVGFHSVLSFPVRSHTLNPTRLPRIRPIPDCIPLRHQKLPLVVPPRTWPRL